MGVKTGKNDMAVHTALVNRFFLNIVYIFTARVMIMPIYEFKCMKCNHFFEILVMSSDEKHEMECPKCKSPNFERVMSTTNYAMGAGGSSGASGPKVENRTCSSGSCTTYDLPGHAK